jgi:hypothetical protein
MIENLNKLTEEVYFFNAFVFLTAGAHEDYNINPYNTLVKTFLCILINLCLEIRLQMIKKTQIS